VAGGGDDVVCEWHLPADMLSTSIGDTLGTSLSPFSPDGHILAGLTGERGIVSDVAPVGRDRTRTTRPRSSHFPCPPGGGFLPHGRTLVTFNLDKYGHASLGGDRRSPRHASALPRCLVIGGQVPM
jgi:hypothetical protein